MNNIKITREQAIGIKKYLADKKKRVEDLRQKKLDNLDELVLCNGCNQYVSLYFPDNLDNVSPDCTEDCAVKKMYEEE